MGHHQHVAGSNGVARQDRGREPASLERMQRAGLAEDEYDKLLDEKKAGPTAGS